MISIEIAANDMQFATTKVTQGRFLNTSRSRTFYAPGNTHHQKGRAFRRPVSVYSECEIDTIKYFHFARCKIIGGGLPNDIAAHCWNDLTFLLVILHCIRSAAVLPSLILIVYISILLLIKGNLGNRSTDVTISAFASYTVLFAEIVINDRRCKSFIMAGKPTNPHKLFGHQAEDNQEDQNYQRSCLAVSACGSGDRF